jgi:hypothetical protein
MRQILTDRIFDSSLDCLYKCHLLLHGRHGTKSEYEEHTERFDEMYQRAAIARLQKMYSDKEIIYLNKITRRALHDSAPLVVIKSVEANGTQSDSIVLARGKNVLGSYQPVFFHRYEKITARAKLLLGFRGAIIQRATGIVLFPYQAKAGCATSAGSRRMRLAPPSMVPALSWS